MRKKKYMMKQYELVNFVMRMRGLNRNRADFRKKRKESLMYLYISQNTLN